MRNTTVQSIVERMRDAEQYTVFVVGDSITEGARATDDEHTYTAVFARGLAERLPNRRVIRYDGKRYPTKDAELLPLMTYGDPIVIRQGGDKTLTVVRSGIGGNTVQRMLNRRDDFIGREVGGRCADLYIVMVGINDALRSDASKFVSPEVFASNLNRLLDWLEQGNPAADLILMTPTYNDRGLEPSSHLTPYADAMRATAARRQIPVVDQHRLWMAHLTVGANNYGQGDWLSGVEGDSCHPSNLGHEIIANELLRCLFA